MKCEAKTAEGTRCKMNATKGKLCGIHAAKTARALDGIERGVEVGPKYVNRTDPLVPFLRVNKAAVAIGTALLGLDAEERKTALEVAERLCGVRR